MLKPKITVDTIVAHLINFESYYEDLQLMSRDAAVCRRVEHTLEKKVRAGEIDRVTFDNALAAVAQRNNFHQHPFLPVEE